MLIEAILALTLAGSTVLLTSKLKHEAHIQSLASDIGADFASVIYAIDRRVFIDGVFSDNGWGEENQYGWNDIATEVLQKELVAHKNPSCGLQGGWMPKHTLNDSLTLISCELATQTRLPLDLDADSVLKTHTEDDNIITSLSFRLFYDNEAKFATNFKFLKDIINGFNHSKTVNITGRHLARYIDRVDDTEVSPSLCYSLGVRCSVEFSFETNLSGIGEDPYLRIDGSNAMLNSITFRARTSQVPTCYSVNENGNKENKPCGIDLEYISESRTRVNTMSDVSVSSEGFYVIPSESSIAVDTMCVDEQGEEAFCGTYLVEGEESMFGTNSYVQIVNASESIGVHSKGSNRAISLLSDGSIRGYTHSGGISIESFSINNDGHANLSSLFIHGKINIPSTSDYPIINSLDTIFENDISVKGTAFIDTIKSSSDEIDLMSDTNVLENLFVKKNSFIEGSLTVNDIITSESEVYAQKELVSDMGLRFTSHITDGTNCGNGTQYDIGVIRTDHDGRVLSCINKDGVTQFSSGSNSSVPIGTIAIWPVQNTPPSGWLIANGQSTSSYPELRSLLGNNTPNLQGLFIRGHGGAAAGEFGVVQGDAIRNITGSFNHDGRWSLATGAFNRTAGSGEAFSSGASYSMSQINFNAAQQVPTADENRPINVAYHYIIKAE